MKKVLIISPHFPPLNTPDMQRVRMSLPYFRELGWEPVVICVHENNIEGYLDPLLEQTFPPDIRVYKVGAWPVKYTRKLGLGSLSMRSFFHFMKKGNALLSKEKFDLVYFSTTAFHVCRLGPYWKRKYKIPFIIDMQDPWRNDFYLDKPKKERPPKFLISYNIDKYLEAATIPVADGIISVSEGYQKTLIERYPSMQPGKFAIIPFGASYLDFEIAAQCSDNDQPVKLPEDRINIVYIGRGGHDLRFALEILFSAFKKGLSGSEALFSNVHFTFIGTSYAPGGKGGCTIKPVAESLGVGEYVTELPARISYFETLSLLKRASVLLVPGSTDTAYTASKIYPYILVKKPLLAVFYYGSSVVSVLKDLDFGNVLSFDHANPMENYTDECLRYFKKALSEMHQEIKLDETVFYKYSAKYKTEEQTRFFEKTVTNYLND